MKTKLLLLLTVAALSGCASQPHVCRIVKFDHKPTVATQDALAATTKDDPAEIRNWFESGERGFVINTTNLLAATNAMNAAKAEGAEIKKP